MSYSDQLLEEGAEVREAQKEHSLVQELPGGTVEAGAFRGWIEQDYRYLLDCARLFAIAGAKPRDERTTTGLLNVAHSTLGPELDRHGSNYQYDATRKRERWSL